MNCTAFVFPGQGSQKTGMGSDLVKNFKAARLTFEEASESVSLKLLDLCTQGPIEELNRTEVTQPALLTAGMAAYRVLVSESDIRPDYLAGHSLGEFTAVTAADGFNLSDAVSLVRKRGQYMQEAVPEGEGAMAAILGLELEELQEICNVVEGVVVPANLNCPGQIVVSGERVAVEEVVELSRGQGAKRAVLLPVSVPSHSPLMEPASQKLKEALDEIAVRDLKVPLVNNVDAGIVRSADEIRDGLVRQLTSPLRWEQGVREMISQGVELFIEVGPGRVLGSLIRRIDRSIQVLNIEDRESLEQIQKWRDNVSC
jgi:[acyl-carrier-protein] S-malonyltransferase